MNTWKKENTKITNDFLKNFDSVPVRTPLHEGRFVTQLIGWELKRNSNDNPYVQLSFTLLNEGYAGYVLNEKAYWTERAQPRSKAIFVALEINPRQHVEDYPPVYAEVELVQDEPGHFKIARPRRITEEEKNSRLNKPASSDSSSTPEKDEQLTIPGSM